MADLCQAVRRNSCRERTKAEKTKLTSLLRTKNASILKRISPLFENFQVTFRRKHAAVSFISEKSWRFQRTVSPLKMACAGNGIVATCNRIDISAIETSPLGAKVKDISFHRRRTRRIVGRNSKTSLFRHLKLLAADQI